jgi:hypothetical protein
LWGGNQAFNHPGNGAFNQVFVAVGVSRLRTGFYLRQ